MFQELPLLDMLYKKFNEVHLEDVAVISCQHILQSNYITLEYLFRLGLKPEHTFILGKSYSTSKEVVRILKERCVFVHRHSSSFNSHESWDNQFAIYAANFLKDIIPQINNLSQIKKIIVIDDGGFIIEQINHLTFSQDLQCIEWTSSGYRRLLNSKLNYSVINVARSKTKLNIESPVIGAGIVQKIAELYPNIINSSKKALVIGAGPIGQSVDRSLKEINKNVDTLDIDTPLPWPEICDFDLVVGCTGEKILSENDINNLHKTLLVSASSSDREFPAVTIRGYFSQSDDPHKDYEYKEIMLANSGFPINFDGHAQFLSLEKIQITLGLIFTSTCLASSERFGKGFNDFPVDVGDEISSEYLRFSRQDN